MSQPRFLPALMIENLIRVSFPKQTRKPVSVPAGESTKGPDLASSETPFVSGWQVEALLMGSPGPQFEAGTL